MRRRPFPSRSTEPGSSSPSTEAEPDEAGWIRRFVGAPPRLQEAVALYESLGLEVRLELPSAVDLEAECEDCAAATALFRVIYTRVPR